MAEQRIEPLRDDAPLAASKRSDAVEVASASLVEDRGDTLVGRSVTINRPLPELFAYWRDFSNLATFMDNVERIEVPDQTRSRWVVRAPGGRTVEWDAVVTEEATDSFIAWASTEGADVPNSGRIDFKDVGARGTVVTATILYDPPGGVVGNNKLQVAASGIVPPSILAESHRKMAEPCSGKD